MSFQSGTNRPEFYDRNPTNVSQGFGNGGIAPHTTAVRWSYTVPANRKAFVNCMNATVLRDGTATTAGRAFADLQLNNTYNLVQAECINVAIGTIDHEVVGSSILLLATDNLRALTADPSTGGTMNYDLHAAILEFDA